MTTEPASDATTAEALYAAGLAAFRRGDIDASRRQNEESARVARQAGYPRGLAKALIGLARVALREGDLDRVHALAAESRSIADQLGDRDGLRLPLHLDAEATRMRGDLGRARKLYEQSIALNRELGQSRMVAIEAGNLAWVEINEGRFDRAATLLEASLGAAREGDDMYGCAFGLIGFARVALARDDAETAARLLGAADALLESDGTVLDPTDAPEYERTLALARTRLGVNAFEHAVTAGSRLSLDDANALIGSKRLVR